MRKQLEISSKCFILVLLFLTTNVFAAEENKQFKSIYEKVTYKGTSNNWKAQEMKLIADNIWYVQAAFGKTSSERFKFDIYGNWALNYGDSNKDGICEQAGNEIYVEGGKVYDITFNDDSKAYTIKETKLIAKIESVKADDRTNITIIIKSNCEKKGEIGEAIKKNKGYIKIRKDGILLPTDVVPDENDKIILMNMVRGTYKITLEANVEKNNYFGEGFFEVSEKNREFSGELKVLTNSSGSYKKKYSTMYIRGTFNEWKPEMMTLVADNIWNIKNIKTGKTATERFKFDVNGDWSINFGKNGTKAGEDIRLEPNSKYDISFNDETCEIKIENVK